MAIYHLYSRVDRHTIEPLDPEEYTTLDELLNFFGLVEPTGHTRNALRDITWFDDIGIDSADLLQNQIDCPAPKEPTTCAEYRNGRGQRIDYQALARKIDQRQRLSDERRAHVEATAQAWRNRWHDEDIEQMALA